jgi:hypothetical protein
MAIAMIIAMAIAMIIAMVAPHYLRISTIISDYLR